MIDEGLLATPTGNAFQLPYQAILCCHFRELITLFYTKDKEGNSSCLHNCNDHPLTKFKAANVALYADAKTLVLLSLRHCLHFQKQNSLYFGFCWKIVGSLNGFASLPNLKTCLHSLELKKLIEIIKLMYRYDRL